MSFYAHVTTKCNMKCRHCIFRCRPGQGKDMPFSLFRHVVDMAYDYEDYVVIGGGEPTLHPDIVLMAAYASFTAPEEMDPMMVTNGTCKQRTWESLMRGMSVGGIDIKVSNDPWHDLSKIRPWVRRDADMRKLWYGNRLQSRYIIAQGRAKGATERLEQQARDSGYKRVVVEEYDDCMDVRITPTGYVWIDMPKPRKIGLFSEESVDRAREILQQFEESQYDE